MQTVCKWKITEDFDKSVRKCDKIPREFWTPEMWQIDKQKKRERERSRKRSYTLAFGQLKETLSIEQKRLRHVDILKLAKDTIVSLSEQLFLINRTKDNNELTVPQLDTKKVKLSHSPSKSIQDNNLSFSSNLSLDEFFQGDTSDLLVNVP